MNHQIRLYLMYGQAITSANPPAAFPFVHFVSIQARPSIQINGSPDDVVLALDSMGEAALSDAALQLHANYQGQGSQIPWMHCLDITGMQAIQEIIRANRPVEPFCMN